MAAGVNRPPCAVAKLPRPKNPDANAAIDDRSIPLPKCSVKVAPPGVSGALGPEPAGFVLPPCRSRSRTRRRGAVCRSRRHPADFGKRLRRRSHGARSEGINHSPELRLSGGLAFGQPHSGRRFSIAGPRRHTRKRGRSRWSFSVPTCGGLASGRINQRYVRGRHDKLGSDRGGAWHTAGLTCSAQRNAGFRFGPIGKSGTTLWQ